MRWVANYKLQKIPFTKADSRGCWCPPHRVHYGNCPPTWLEPEMKIIKGKNKKNNMLCFKHMLKSEIIRNRVTILTNFGCFDQQFIKMLTLSCNSASCCAQVMNVQQSSLILQVKGAFRAKIHNRTWKQQPAAELHLKIFFLFEPN